MILRAYLAILLTGWTTACGKQDGDGSSGHSETTPSTVSSGTNHDAGTSSPTTSGSSTGVTPDTTSSAGSDPGTSTPPTMGDLGGLACDPETPLCCDPWTQDCPQGEKCSWWAYDGGSNWDGTKCFPIMADPAPVGDSCFVVDGALSGQDNCDRGAMCWEVWDGMGRCFALCTGSGEAPECPQKNLCKTFSEGLSLCFEHCDPLLQDCTTPNDLCLPNFYSAGFACMNDSSGDEGQIHDPCDHFLKCDPGNICTPSSAAVECDIDEPGCCEPFCDLTLPNSCPGQGQECVPAPIVAPLLPGDENVGYCSLPG